MSSHEGRTSDEEKIILNGGTAGAVLEKTCTTIYSFTEHSHFSDQDAKELVKLANDIEDQVFRFQRKVLDAVGFKGPWPKALQ